MIKVEVKGNELERVIDGSAKELRGELVWICTSILTELIEKGCRKGYETDMLLNTLADIGVNVRANLTNKEDK